MLRSEEQLLEQLQEKWPAVSVQTSWKLEPVLSYGDIPDNPDPPTAEQQMEYGKRSTANSGSAGADPGGGLRVLKHPPKLPKIYYLLFNIVD